MPEKKTAILFGCLLLVVSCGGPVVVEVPDGSTYANPQDGGVIASGDGTEFKFYSNVGGLNAVVRFQVPATGEYKVRYQGQDLFYVWIRLSQMGEALVTPAHEVTHTISLSADTAYYLEIEQGSVAKLGATIVRIWPA